MRLPTPPPAEPSPSPVQTYLPTYLPTLPVAQAAPVVPPKNPEPVPDYKIPKFDLRVEELAHPGAVLFFALIHPTEALTEAVLASYKWLYTPETAPTNVEKITLVLRTMQGVAYTTGSHTEKEIHFSLDHILNSIDRAKDEIIGVLVHEVVHCYQHNAKGTAPGGLIEGVADFVRLNENLAPPHWKPRGGDQWDAGYDLTAYFLDWIDKRYGENSIKKLNLLLKDREWNEDVLLKEVTGRTVSQAWTVYCESLEK